MAVATAIFRSRERSERYELRYLAKYLSKREQARNHVSLDHGGYRDEELALIFRSRERSGL